MTLYLRPDLRAALPAHDDPFTTLLTLPGELIRAREGRRTTCVVLAGKAYFLKAHFGVGWKEIFKNLVQLRLPVVSARNEWRAIRQLEQLGVATTPLAGYGIRGWNPARLHSFVITDALENTVTLEVFCKPWGHDPPRTRTAVLFKRALIASVAEIARRLHTQGINHRDFYLCHFRLVLSAATVPGVPCLYLLDLHRAQLRARTPRRWIVKDIGSLYFSALDIGLTRRDLLRFIQHYRQQPLRSVLPQEQRFWRAVHRRARQLYRKHQRKAVR
jgi:heptose I phosphotransferase